MICCNIVEVKKYINNIIITVKIHTAIPCGPWRPPNPSSPRAPCKKKQHLHVFLLHKISKQRHSCTLNAFVCQTKMSNKFYWQLTKRTSLQTDQNARHKSSKKRGRGKLDSCGSCCFCHIWPIKVLVNPAHIFPVCAEIYFTFCVYCCQERKNVFKKGQQHVVHVQVPSEHRN